MDLFISKENLIQILKSNSEMNLEYRQISNRLKKILPLRLKEIKEEYIDKNSNVKKAKCQRLALLDLKYKKYIEEYIDISYNSLYSKIQYETYFMLFNARQSSFKAAPKKTF